MSIFISILSTKLDKTAIIALYYVKQTLLNDKGYTQMIKKSHKNSLWEQQQYTNIKSLSIWTSAWVCTTAIATFGPEYIWQYLEKFTIIAIVFNMLVGFGMILSNKRFLHGQDELQQKITLEAMALTLGIGLIVGLSYSLLETTHIISSSAEISHLMIIMGLTYLLTTYLGHRKYK